MRHIHFLHLVGDVFAFGSFTHAVTFDGLGQNHGRTTFGVLCRFKGCVQF